MRSFKKILRPVLVVLVLGLLLKVLDFMLYPCTFMRNDIHAVCTRDYEDIFLGTSHGKMNIDPDTVAESTGRRGHNLCVGGEYGIDAYYLARLIEEKQDPVRIIYEIDPGYFVSEKEEGNNYLLFYHEFPLSRAKAEYFADAIAKCNFRTMLFPWYEYPLEYELGKLKDTVYQKWNQNYDVSYLKGQAQEYHDSGFIQRYPVDTSKLTMNVSKLYQEGAVNQQNMEYLEKLINFCKEKDIEFVAVTTPLPGATLKQYQENFEAAWKYFENFFQEQQVPYLNFNTKYYKAFSHKIDYYTDYDGHMNGQGARAYSKVLGELLKDLQK